MSQAQVTITRRGAERVRGGHLWVYRSDVRGAEGAEGGSVVAVRDERGRLVAQALYSDRSEIALRVLTTKDEAVGREWWRERLRASAERRAGLERASDAFRLIYSEGDLLPSLIVDRYSDVLVVQTLSQGAESLKATLVELLVEEFAPRAVVERNDVRVRSLEGLPLQTGVLYGDAPEELRSEEHTSELQSHSDLVCRLLLEKKKKSAIHTRSVPCRSATPQHTERSQRLRGRVPGDGLRRDQDWRRDG